MANSPWGTIQYSTVYAKGFKSVGTAGHGGFMLSEKFAEEHLSAAAIKRGDKFQEGRYVRTLRTYICFEEDCDWAIPALELLNQFGDKMFAHCPPQSEYATQEGRRKAIIRCLSGWNADYLLEKGIEPDAERYAEYLRWKERDRLAEQQSPDLIVSASGDWHEMCHSGEVLVVTADDRTHFVTAQSYQARAERGGQNLLSDCVLSRNRMQEGVAELWV